MRTTSVLYGVIGDALVASGLPRAALWGITDPDRAIPAALLKEKRWIDVVVPRGGEGLIDFVVQNSSIPIIKNDRGLCHVYVHADADLGMAADLVENAKTQRPGVCNAMETLLVHETVAAALLPALYDRLTAKGGAKRIDWYGDEATCTILAAHGADPARVSAATDDTFDTEWLDFKLSARVVPSFEEAVAHIERHGSRHSECIVTRDAALAHRFQQEIDAAAVYWNASTRFTDGFSLGAPSRPASGRRCTWPFACTASSAHVLRGS
jgi:glutamate-5-semialdehyde dehydrogenase